MKNIFKIKIFRLDKKRLNETDFISQLPPIEVDNYEHEHGCLSQLNQNLGEGEARVNTV